MNDQTDHDVEAALARGAARLRSQAPDEAATERALAETRRRSTFAPIEPRRPWWPALVGVGLAAATVAAVFVLRSDDQTTTVVPADTTVDTVADPSPEPLPETVPDSAPDSVPTAGSLPDGDDIRVDVIGERCFEITTADGSALGCFAADEPATSTQARRVVADAGRAVGVSFSFAPDGSLENQVVPDEQLIDECGGDQLTSRVAAGRAVEVAACSDLGVLVRRMAASADDTEPATFFTLPSMRIAEGAELGVAGTVDGLPGALAFAYLPPDGRQQCAVLWTGDREGWYDLCSATFEYAGPAPSLILVDGEVYEVVVDGATLGAVQPLELPPAASGCSLASVHDLLDQILEFSAVTAIGCVGDDAALMTSAVALSSGPIDGSIWTARRTGDSWELTDSGTGIETTITFPLVRSTTSAPWPVGTVPRVPTTLSERILAIGEQAEIGAIVDGLLGVLETPSDPEFPTNERIVAELPDGLPLLVAQIDTGGDDSVNGQMVYVWLGDVFGSDGSKIGWRPRHVLVSDLCARGSVADATSADVCV